MNSHKFDSFFGFKVWANQINAAELYDSEKTTYRIITKYPKHTFYIKISYRSQNCGVIYYTTQGTINFIEGSKEDWFSSLLKKDKLKVIWEEDD